MRVFKTIPELKTYLLLQQKKNKSIGFVPTMGALHQGHLSLVKQAKEQCDINVVSIFVNPTQFNEKSDLDNYPRNTQADIDLLQDICDVVFIPEVGEIYPEEDTRTFDFDGIDTIMEGKHRPGHFNGVAQVVSKLFSIVNPDKAFFGQKDFQQVAIIKKMTEKLNLSVKIIPSPIIREPDGLAMSSRNQRLTKKHRPVANAIYNSLKISLSEIETLNVEKVKQNVIDRINKERLLEVEYFEIVDQEDLKPVSKISQPAVGCIAVWAGDIRLIDNVVYNL